MTSDDATVMVALLRGVNVGGKGKLAMSDLRDAVEGCGYGDVRTYIQSGNVVLSATTRDPAEVAARLREALDGISSPPPDVVVRSRDELAAVVDDDPFVRRGEDPAHVHVVFTDGGTPAAIDALELDRYEPEEAAAIGNEIHLFLPSGMGRSKLAADLARRTKGNGTTRNWRTVTKLLEMARELP